jgi:hypothetical protein
MGDLTYSEAFDEVKVALGNRTDVDDRISFAVNAAYRNIATSFRHYELEAIVQGNLVIGSRRYLLPSDLRVILDLRDETNGIKLEKFDYRAFDQMKTFPSGNPTRYARFGSYFEIDATPTAANLITLRYAKRIESVSGSQKFLTPSEWDEAVVLGAIYRVLNRIGEYDKAEKAKADYLEFVNSLTEPHAIDDEDLDQPLGVRIGR